MSSTLSERKTKFFDHIIDELGIEYDSDSKKVRIFGRSRRCDLFSALDKEVFEFIRDYVGEEFNDLRSILLDGKKMTKEAQKEFINYVEKRFEEEVYYPEEFEGLFNGEDQIVYDLQSADIYLYYARTNNYAPVSMDALRKLCINAGTKVESLPNQICYIGYNPEKDSRFYHEKLDVLDSGEKKATQIKIFNLYNKPRWQYLVQPSETAPKLFEQIVTTLIPDQTYRAIFFAWLYHAIFDRRANTVLTVKGALGAGKNLILESVLEKLVGESNYKKANSSLFTKEFNSVFRNSKVVFVDEVSIKKEAEKNKLKSYLNEKISVEAKGKDAQTIRNTASVIVSSNHLDDMEVLSHDRRFCAIRITDVQEAQKKLVGEEKIGLFIRKLEDPKYVQAIGNYISFIGRRYMYRINSGDDIRNFNSHTVLRTDAFWELVYKSMTPWQRFIILRGYELFKQVESHHSKAAYEVEYYKKFYKKQNLYGDNKSSTHLPSDSRIEKFIEEHKSPQGEIVGWIDLREEEGKKLVKYFVYNHKYFVEYDKIFKSNFKNIGDQIELVEGDPDEEFF